MFFLLKNYEIKIHRLKINSSLYSRSVQQKHCFPDPDLLGLCGSGFQQSAEVHLLRLELNTDLGSSVNEGKQKEKVMQQSKAGTDESYLCRQGMERGAFKLFRPLQWKWV